MSIQEEYARLIAESGKTKTEIAGVLGWSRQRLWSYTSGKIIPTVTAANEIARAIGVEAYEIVKLYIKT